MYVIRALSFILFTEFWDDDNEENEMDRIVCVGGVINLFQVLFQNLKGTDCR